MIHMILVHGCPRSIYTVKGIFGLKFTDMYSKELLKNGFCVVVELAWGGIVTKSVTLSCVQGLHNKTLLVMLSNIRHKDFRPSIRL